MGSGRSGLPCLALVAVLAAAPAARALPSQEADHGQHGDRHELQYRGAPVDLGDDAARLGEVIADLRFVDLDGVSASLSSIAGPAGLVIVMRDVGCPVSMRFGPRLARFERRWAERGVGFLYVNATPDTSSEEARDEVAGYGFEAPYVMDSEGAVARELSATTSTEVFVLDDLRRLVYRGAVDDQYGLGYSKPEPTTPYLADALDALLKGTQPAVRATLAPGCYLSAQ